MRKSFFSAVFLLFLLVPALITWAQPHSALPGLNQISINLPNGIIKIYLPDDIRPGELISGTIRTEAAGQNAKQKEKALGELLKRELKIGHPGDPAQVSVSLMKLYPEDRGSGLLRLDSIRWPFQAVLSVSYLGKTEFSLPLDPGFPRDLPATGEAKCQVPEQAVTGAPVRISGSFDGNSANTRCLIDGKSMNILAESPRECFALMPEQVNGRPKMEIIENGGSLCSRDIYAVHLDIKAGKLGLQKGESTYVDVNITGLLGLTSPATLTVSNLSKGIVKMQPSDFERMRLYPDSIPGGNFSRRFYIQSLRSGDFNVNVNLNLPGDPPQNRPVQNSDIRGKMNESGYPGSYGYLGDQPCEPEGKTITWRWHRTFSCEVDDREVLYCGHTHEGAKIYELIKELLEKLELDQASDIAEKMAKAFSTAKTFSYSVHLIRKWVDYDVNYKCVNGKWTSVGGAYVSHGRDDLGWHQVKNPDTDCWLTFNDKADEQKFMEALENTIRNACR